MKNSPQILNPKIMRDLIGNDPGLIAQFKQDFVAQARTSLRELATHYNNREFAGLKQKAHFLKTSAKAIGAEEVADKLQHLEYAALGEDMPQCKQLIIQLKNALQSLIEVINS
ncbi:Hpt domain-containing protein [Shewanella loihica]|uniref:Hpt protein n=1 Tax=Shewanella loihica (strain ATCC BAA-1088 / PV-4) TaxID=323850 RepID=A3QBC9_SHELP|nr:Hpt domain-containing protein [Shewanella loihica]ABO22777.1 Hpt protein [Shewanella loihica PV-4]